MVEVDVSGLNKRILSADLMMFAMEVVWTLSLKPLQGAAGADGVQ